MKGMEEGRPDTRLLVREVLNGNQSAFETLIGFYERLVAHVVYRMVADHDDRQDLCQEVFVKVYRNLGSFQFNARLSTWIARIAYNTCLHHLEKKQVPLLDDMLVTTSGEPSLELVAADLPGPDTIVEAADLRSRVRQEIAQLPPLYGVIVTLYHLEDMAYEEIAAVLELPLGTVKSYLFRARRMLKERLTEKYEPEEIRQ